MFRSWKIHREESIFIFIKGIYCFFLMWQIFMQWRAEKMIVTGYPLISQNIPSKSFLWRGLSLSSEFSLTSELSARIISRMKSIHSPSKNICSVRQRSIPDAQSCIATFACLGLSVFMLTTNYRYLYAQLITASNIRYL